MFNKFAKRLKRARKRSGYNLNFLSEVDVKKGDFLFLPKEPPITKMTSVTIIRKY